MASQSKNQNDSNKLPIDVIPQKSVPKKAQKIGSAAMIANQLPGLIGAHELSGAYKVVFPEGVVGNLMTLKNGQLSGLNTTSIIGKSKDIVGQAGLQSLSGLANPLVVFSVMSMITGQYFMAQINKSLTELTESIEAVERQVDVSEEGGVFSAIVFLQEIKNDWGLILSSEEYKRCVINNVLQKINDLTSSSYYFVNRLNSKLCELQKQVSGRRPTLDESLIQEINRIKDYFKYSLEVRNHMKVLLVYLTSGITVYNAEEVKATIKRDSAMMFSYTIKQLDHVIDSVIDSLINVSKVDLQEKAKLIRDDIVEIRTITRDGYNDSVSMNLVETIDNFAELDSKGKTFYIYDGLIYA